jgi:hypothetical protein
MMRGSAGRTLSMRAKKVSEKVVLDGLKKKEGHLRFLNSQGARGIVFIPRALVCFLFFSLIF